MPDTDLKLLITEFTEQAKLTELAACRSAFCAGAYYQGWPQVKIARYMGITRARVGQRLAKFRWYLDERYDMPVLRNMMDGAAKPRADQATAPVEFDIKDWDDPDFVVGMLRQLG